MAEPLLSIGGVQFQVHEQPDSLPLGGEQSTSVIKFPGGGINVQTLGAFEDVISLKGTFWYEGALDRALQMDTFRINGSEVLLKWGSVTRYVTITKFQPVIYTQEWVDYSMELQPTRSSNTLVSGASLAVNSKPADVQAKAATSTPVVNNSGVTITAQATKQAVKYRVVAGDTLWKIAVKFYGPTNGSKCYDIASANNIENPNEIETGQLLTIPQ